VDFYDVKGDLEAWLAPHQASFEKTTHPALHPGRSANILIDGRVVGVLGELHPRWVQKYELGDAPVVFELELDALLNVPAVAYVDVSRFPAVSRDIALVVPQAQAAGELLAALRAAAPAIVRDIALFDMYQGKGLGENQKSLAFHIVMQDTARTLEDAEIEAAIAQLVAVAARDFAASLR
jgi:phenylalanyl-tRNA synthetase beta chain